MPPESETSTKPDAEPMQLHITTVSINCRKLTLDELPESLESFADISKAYGILKKSDMREYVSPYFNVYMFNTYLLAMYHRARENSTVFQYEYDNQKFMDFPVENPINQIRLYASFIPNRKIPDTWFFLGFRRGGKINDLAVLGDPVRDYSLVQSFCDLKQKGITSCNELRHHLEDAFITAIENTELYQYTLGNQTFIEYPLNLTKKDTGDALTILFLWKENRKKWQYQKICWRNARYPLQEAIRKEEEKGWIRSEQEKERKLQEKEEAEKREKEWKAQEEEKQLIPFLPFPIRKIADDTGKEYYHTLTRFAYLKEIPYLYDKHLGFNLRDEEEVLQQITASFNSCNPYTDISYYQISGEKNAELPLHFPQYPGRELYAVFDENRNRQKQPWHLKRLEYNDIFHRFMVLENASTAVAELTRLIPSEKTGIISAAELDAYLQKSFMTAISNDAIFVYGEYTEKYAELPLDLKTDEGEHVHALFILGRDLKHWKFTGFKKRYGKYGDDVRYSISDEYKQMCARQPQFSSFSEIKRKETECREITEHHDNEPKTQVSRGEMIPDADGNPQTLRDFSKEITDEELHLLAEMAENELWGFTEEEPFGILYRYLNTQFIRLGYERKILVYHHHAKNSLNDYTAIHTGLYSRYLHEPIYAGFKMIPLYSLEYTGPLWKLDGFCCKSEGGPVYDNIIRRFSDLPENCDFMRENGTYLPLNHFILDRRENIILKEEHILKERGYRLPIDFIRKAFNRTKDGKADNYLERLALFKENGTEEILKEFWITEFSAYLESLPETYDKLLQLLQFVVEEAQACNIRRPIPTYYPRDNKIVWLLPLRFNEESNLKNLALIVGRREQGGYKGITLMNIEDVYHRSRVIENPDNSWLKSDVFEPYCPEFQQNTLDQ